MSLRHYANHAAQQSLAGSITNSATSLTISGSFAGWPTSFPFFAELDRGTASAEIISVTNIAGLVATIVRAQDGDAALSHPAGATIDFIVIAQDFREANTHVNATSAAHGVSGSLVGTSDAQTLTNKTLTAPVVDGNMTSSDGTVNVLGGIAATGDIAATGKVSGTLVAKQFANEAAATAAGVNTLGAVVWLTAPTVGQAGPYAYNGSAWKQIPIAGDYGFIGESASVSQNVTLSTTSAVAADASGAVTFTLTRQTRVEITTQVRYNPAASVANARYQTQVGYNSGGAIAFGSFVGLGKVYDVENNSTQQSSANPTATVLLAAGTYTAYASIRRINAGSATDTADAFYTIVKALGNV